MKFVGSVYFALILIALTLLFVIGGTFLESWSGSHLYAASFTYSSPVFHLLLALYFVNILVSTLLRLPFKKHHIPFITTHLGLLLLLTGVFVKSYFGLQGAMGIAEGSGSDRIFLPNTYALLVEGRGGQTLFPLKKRLSCGPLAITLLEWSPHAEERFEGFIKGEWGHLLGLPPFQVDGPPLKTSSYTIHATKKQPEEILFPGHAALYFLQDREQKEHLIAFNEVGTRFSQVLDNQSFMIFDKGYGGYGVFAELPPSFPTIELIAPLTRASRALPAHRKKEELKPRIRLLLQEGSKSEVLTLTFDPFATSFKWPALQGDYLFRFQSFETSIPLHVRLREAREICYPGTSKPYSYEARLQIEEEETTISMNHVFEKKGFRFYLANLLSPPLSAKRAQIVVNYDPAKYLLTYPGAILLAIGIALLYLRGRYV